MYFSCLQTLSINNAGSTRDCDWNVNETRFLPCSSVGLWSSRQLFLRQIWVTTLRGVICAHTGPFSQRLSRVEFSPAPFAFFFFFFFNRQLRDVAQFSHPYLFTSSSDGHRDGEWDVSVSEHSQSLRIEGKVADSHGTVRHAVGL